MVASEVIRRGHLRLHLEVSYELTITATINPLSTVRDVARGLLLLGNVGFN